MTWGQEGLRLQVPWEERKRPKQKGGGETESKSGEGKQEGERKVEGVQVSARLRFPPIHPYFDTSDTSHLQDSRAPGHS